MFHAYCLIHEEIEVQEQYLNQFLHKLAIHPVDLVKLTHQVITIEDIRNLKQFLSLKPFASAYKAAQITASSLTYPAQQALLKTVEEPPDHSVIFFLATNSEVLLPTILSRCSIIRITTDKTGMDQVNHQVQFWQQLLKLSPIARFKYTPDLTKDRYELIFWLEKQTRFFRDILLNFYHSRPVLNLSPVNLLIIIKALGHTRTLVKKNLSIKLCLDNLWLQIPQT